MQRRAPAPKGIKIHRQNTAVLKKIPGRGEIHPVGDTGPRGGGSM